MKPPAIPMPEHEDITQLRECIPTLRAELFAAEYMLAEATGQNAKTQRVRFMKAAGRITGALPPMTDATLRIIANQKRG